MSICRIPRSSVLSIPLSRRSMVRAGLASLGMLGLGGLAGCGASGEDTLNLFTWASYVPDDVLNDFMDKESITVNSSTFDSNEDMLSKYKSGSEGMYDIINPTGYMVARMIEEDLLAELDTSKLENYKNINSAFLDLGYDPGNAHSVPYLASATAIAYNKDAWQGDDVPKSWKDLLDPKYEGSIAVVDNSLELGAVFADIVGTEFDDEDGSHEDQYRDLAAQLKPNIALFNADCITPLVNEDATIAIIYTASAALAQVDNPAIDVSFPEEGINLAIDNWVIPHDAVNVDNALKFIDYILEADVAASISGTYPYVQPNEAALESLGSDFLDNPAKNVPADIIEKAHYYTKPISADVTSMMEDIWNSLKQ